MDDNIIELVDYYKTGVSKLYGSIIKSIAKLLAGIVKDRNEDIPTKAVRDKYPMFYWVALPQHKNFLCAMKTMRTKFNLCLESTLRNQPNMHVIKLKEVWSYHDDETVDKITGNMTLQGQKAYWRAVDAAFKFNVERFAGFNKTTKKTIIAKPKKALLKPSKQEVKTNSRNDMIHFFHKRRQHDHFHWENDKNNKFWLPRPKPY